MPSSQTAPPSEAPCCQADYLDILVFSSSSASLSASQDSGSEAPGSLFSQGFRVSSVELPSSGQLPPTTPHAPIGVRPSLAMLQDQPRRYEREVGVEGECRASNTLLGEGYAQNLSISLPPIGGLGYAKFSAVTSNSPALPPPSASPRTRSSGKSPAEVSAKAFTPLRGSSCTSHKLQRGGYEREVGVEGESRVSTPLLGEGYAQILSTSLPPIGGLGYANFSAEAASSPALLLPPTVARPRARSKPPAEVSEGGGGCSEQGPSRGGGQWCLSREE
jgi:hypothetical protein